MKKQIITVQNVEGDANTNAETLIQNRINYIPKVSVIIPVYNVEQYLRECLDSVVNQTLKEIEIICVDDGSTDGSLEILKEYAKKDKRITIITQKNLHAGIARNAGLTVAKGEYLSFLDSDDFFELNMLEEMYNKAENNDSDIVVCLYKNYNNQTKVSEEVRGINPLFNKEIATVSPKNIKDIIFTICNPMPWNKLFKKDFVINNNLKFQSLPVCNDVYFSMMSMACSKKLTFYYKPFINYRYNRKESSRNIRDKHPFCFYSAYKQIYLSLKNKKLYNYYKKAFLTSLVSSSIWTLDNTDLMHNEVMKLIRDKIIPEFDVFCGLLPDYLLNKLKDKIKPELIISLTSYPARINTVNQAIETLLNQTIKADKVILWLAPEQFPNKEKDLPKQLLDLKEKGLIIDWYHDICSYKKLIPTLKKYPDAIIVTADDDNLYKPEWLEKLYNSYKKYPNDINCHRCSLCYYNNIFRFIPGGTNYYKNANYLNKICTGAGAIFFPGCFNKDILNEELFMKLAPTNDDLWVWFQCVLNKKKIRVVENPIYSCNYIPGSQDVALSKINDAGLGLFWKDFNRLLDYYSELKTMMIKEGKKYKGNIEIRSRFEKQLKEWYERGTRKNLDLNRPKTYNEKIQWLKLYDSTPEKTRLADKYLVRDWVKEKIGEEYLIPLLGVWDNFDEINFDKLPEQFVLKCNHGSGYNIIVKDKSKLDLIDVKNKVNKWMNENFAFCAGYELHYRDIKPKIIIEKYIENVGTDDLYDYKFWCFNGKVYYIQFLSERNLGGLKMAFYDRNWNKQNFAYDHPVDGKFVEKPTNLDEMLKLAEELSKGFNHVRVDFYRMNDGKLYFGEMTFTSATGRQRWTDENINKYLGSLIKLPKLAYDIDTRQYYKLPRSTLFNLNRSFIPKYSIFGIPLYKSNKQPHRDWSTKIYLFGIPTYIIRQKGNVKRHLLFNFFPLYKRNKLSNAEWTKKIYILGIPTYIIRLKNGVKRYSLLNFIPLYKRQRMGNNYVKKFYLFGLQVLVLKKQNRKRIAKIFGFPFAYEHTGATKRVWILGIKFQHTNKYKNLLLQFNAFQSRVNTDLREIEKRLKISIEEGLSSVKTDSVDKHRMILKSIKKILSSIHLNKK